MREIRRNDLMSAASQLAPNGEPTGGYDVRESIVCDLRARIATNLAPAVLSSEAIVRAMREEGRGTSPKAIASMACDIARELVEQYKERGWTIDVSYVPSEAT